MTTFRYALPFLALTAILPAQTSPGKLTSGMPATFKLGPVTRGTLYHGDYSYVISVPAGAGKLDIQLSTQPAGADVDLFARFGKDVDLSGSTVYCDFKSEGDGGNERISITTASNPVLQRGDYYIAFGLFTPNVEATVTLTATVAAAGGAGPVVPANGVVNAADGTASFAPGTILSIYGTNLATGIEKGPLPMVTTLLGSYVDVQSDGQFLQAPLFFVSPGQINALLPYEVRGGAAQVRVRTAGGVSDWAPIQVGSSAPRILTVNMRGNGAAIMQHASDYSLVSNDSPAKSGEILILYLIGLGQTVPPARTGQAAGDGGAKGALNASPNVAVTMGGRTAEVLWAGLTPGLAGLYQINVRVPEGLSTGDAAIVVRMAGADSQQNVAGRIGAGGGSTGGGQPPATAVVGPGGATVGTGGATVTIPAGSFDRQATIKVSQITAAPPPAAGRVTAVSRVEGLPAVVKAPLTLALDVVGTPPAGKALMFVRFEGEEGRGPMVLPAEVRDGKLVAALPAMPAGSDVPQNAGKPDGTRDAAVDANPLNAALWGMAGIAEEKSPGGKAAVHYHVGDIKDFDLAVEVGKLADEAFNKLKQIGVDIDRRKAPVDIYLFSFTGTLGSLFLSDRESEGETETELWGKESVGLSLNLDVVRTQGVDAVRTTVGHELFHILQGLYDPRPLWRRSYIKSPWLWMMDAASTWFEKKMSRESEYLSPNALAYSDFLMAHGLEFPPGSKQAVQRHGYGASMFLEYMTKYKGDTFAGEIFRQMEPSTGIVMLEPKNSPVEGLYLNEIMLAFKWCDFVQRLAAGEVHPRLSMVNLLQAKNAKIESYTFASDADAGTTFRWDAPDLSARLYKLDFKKWTTQWPADTKVKIKLTGPRDAELSVWKYESGQGWVMLVKTASEYEIEKAEKLAENGAMYVLLAANGTMNRPYDKTNPVTLEIKGPPPVKGPFPAGAPLFGVELETRSAITIKRTVKNGPTSTGPQYLSWSSDNGAYCRNCTVLTLGKMEWNGGSFTAKREEKHADGKCTFTYSTLITGQLSPDSKTVTTMTVKANNSTRCDGNNDESYEFTIQSAKLQVGPNGVEASWNLNGPATGILSGVKYSRHYWDSASDELHESVDVNYGSGDWSVRLLFTEKYW